MPFNTANETGLKILIAAEKQFATAGYNGVSLRQITVSAKVNLAAVNYHYYDKQSLYLEIVRYRLQEINRCRLDKLNQVEARAGNSAPSVQEIIEIMAQPLFQPSADPKSYNASSMRLLGRLLTENLPDTAEVIRTELQPVMARFGQSLRRHLPRLSPQDFIWQVNLVVGALHHALATAYDMKNHSRGICPNDDDKGAFENFVRFASNALSN